MAALVLCTGKDFTGLVNPYTGEPIVVKMMATPSGKCLFTAPDTYSTARPFRSPREAYNAWSREYGIEDVRKGDRIRCAYTGRDLEIEETPDGMFRYSGGFDPNMFYERAEFLYYVTMRDGVPVRPAPEPEIPVSVPSAMEHFTKTHETELTDEAIHRAEKAMKAANYAPPKKTKVSMSIGRKGSK